VGKGGVMKKKKKKCMHMWEQVDNEEFNLYDDKILLVCQICGKRRER
jgi:hypothetical protein